MNERTMETLARAWDAAHRESPDPPFDTFRLCYERAETELREEEETVRVRFGIRLRHVRQPGDDEDVDFYVDVLGEGDEPDGTAIIEADVPIPKPTVVEGEVVDG